MDPNALFITASRKKLRIPAGRGEVTVEDLWDLHLNSLDQIAIALDEATSKGKKSFIGKRDTEATLLDLKFEIVKFVIATKMEEADKRTTKAAKAAERETLKAMLENKRMEALAALTPEEIAKRMEALDADD